MKVLFLACSLLQGGACKSYSLDLDAKGPFGCMFAAQVEMAKWANAHPNHSIFGWTCGARSLVRG